MKSIRTPVILVVLILLVMLPVTASAAYDMFIQAQHQDWIEVTYFKHELGQPKGGSDSGGVEGNLKAGRADHGVFTIQKQWDSASPKLAEYFQKGQKIPTGVFELREPVEGENRILMKYTFKNAKVVMVKPAASGETPAEVRFAYGEIHWEYTPTVSNNARDIPLKGLYKGGILEVNSEEVIKGDSKLLSFN